MGGKLEQVARRICEDEWGPRSWSLVSNHARNKAYRHARAAIEALSEPDTAMTDAMASVLSFTEDNTGVAADVWRAGIGAISREVV